MAARAAAVISPPDCAPPFSGGRVLFHDVVNLRRLECRVPAPCTEAALGIHALHPGTFDGEDAILVDYQDYHWRTEKMATRMHNPPHPGEILQDTVLGEDGLTVTEFARQLGVSRVALSRVVNGRAAVSADMALRLAAALGGSAESWLRMQASHDLWHAAKKGKVSVRPLNLGV